MPMSLDGLLEKHCVVGSVVEAIDLVRGILNGANGRSRVRLWGVIWQAGGQFNGRVGRNRLFVIRLKKHCAGLAYLKMDSLNAE